MTEVKPYDILWKKPESDREKCADFYFVGFKDEYLKELSNIDRVDKILTINIWEVEAVY